MSYEDDTAAWRANSWWRRVFRGYLRPWRQRGRTHHTAFVTTTILFGRSTALIHQQAQLLFKQPLRRVLTSSHDTSEALELCPSSFFPSDIRLTRQPFLDFYPAPLPSGSRRAPLCFRQWASAADTVPAVALVVSSRFTLFLYLLSVTSRSRMTSVSLLLPICSS